jgi:chondroitin 4-sulfotransferase 11
MYSNSHKFIFVHVGKCGGTSIKNAICNAVYASAGHPGISVRSDHTSLQEMTQMIVKDGFNPDEYFKFTAIRNPWDQMVSLYYHHRTLTRRIAPTATPKEIARIHAAEFKGSFEEFITRTGSRKTNENGASFPLALNGCAKYDDMDYIIKYENINADFAQVCNHIKLPGLELPHWQHNTGRPSTDRKEGYKQYYNDKTQAIVATLFKNVIDYFGYKF